MYFLVASVVEPVWEAAGVHTEKAGVMFSLGRKQQSAQHIHAASTGRIDCGVRHNASALRGEADQTSGKCHSSSSSFRCGLGETGVAPHQYHGGHGAFQAWN